MVILESERGAVLLDKGRRMGSVTEQKQGRNRKRERGEDEGRGITLGKIRAILQHRSRDILESN